MKTDFDVPKHIRCPHCGGRLMLEVDEWLSESGIPTEAGCHVSCVDAPEDSYDIHYDIHYDMPCVYWLPLEHRVYLWAREHVRVMESEEETRERLRAWNAGEPLSGGMG
jgi:hypothetical protein